MNQSLYKSHLNDPKFRGEKTPDHLTNGPMEDRGCTDLLCYILFMACWVGSIFIAIYAFKKGEPKLAFSPADSSNNTCGIGSYEQFPHIYFTKIRDLKTTVCVNACPHWSASEAKPTSIECKPNTKVTSCDSSVVDIYNTTLFAGIICFPSSNTTLVSEISRQLSLPEWQTSMTDLSTAKWMILGAPVFALVIGFLWIVLLRYCAGPMTWLLIVLYFVALVGGGFWAFHGASNPDSINLGLDLKDYSKALKISAYVAWTIAAISLVLFVCFFRRIELGVAVMKCASEFIEDVPQILVIPPIFFIFNVIYFVYWAVVAVYLWSVGDVSFNASGYPIKHVEHSGQTTLFAFLHVWHGLWIFFFLMAVPQFIIASTTCYWYFEAGEEQNLHSPVWKSFWRGTILHGGSLAFGSAILSFVAIVRIIMAYLHSQVKEISEQTHENGCVQCIYSSINCCLDCFERFIRFINKHAYVQIAMTGESFCKAAEDAFFLGVRNAVRLGAVNGLGTIFTFIGEIFITAVVVVISYTMLTRLSYYQESLYNPVVPTIFIGIVAFVVASNFMSILGTSADTIIHVFCMDEEIHTYGAKHAPPRLREFIDEHFGQKLLTN